MRYVLLQLLAVCKEKVAPKVIVNKTAAVFPHISSVGGFQGRCTHHCASQLAQTPRCSFFTFVFDADFTRHDDPSTQGVSLVDKTIVIMK